MRWLLLLSNAILCRMWIAGEKKKWRVYVHTKASRFMHHVPVILDSPPRERHARMRFESTASKNIAKLHSKLDRLTPLLQMFIHALLARKNRAYLLERNIASNHAETTGLTLDDWHHET
jgi:hypothetical protein